MRATSSRRRSFSLPEADLLERVLERQQDVVAAERFFQKIESAGARGFDGFGDGAVAGDHDGGRQDVAFADVAQEIDAAAVGQADVEQQQVGALGRGLRFGRCCARA